VRISEDKSEQKRLVLVCEVVYDPKELSGVTTARTRVAGVLQMVSEPTHGFTGVYGSVEKDMVARRVYVHMTRGSSGRNTVWYECC
jgi:hypothetical protein